jgi:hypothetical protein
MPNLVTIKMQNPPAIPTFLALSTQKSPTRFHEDPLFQRTIFISKNEEKLGVVQEAA